MRQGKLSLMLTSVSVDLAGSMIHPELSDEAGQALIDAYVSEC